MSWLLRLFLFIASLFSAYEVGHTIAAREQIQKPQKRPAVIYQEPERPRPKRAEYGEEATPKRAPECGNCRERIIIQRVPIVVQIAPPPRPAYSAPAPRYVIQPRPTPVRITRYLYR